MFGVGFDSLCFEFLFSKEELALILTLSGGGGGGGSEARMTNQLPFRNFSLFDAQTL